MRNLIEEVWPEDGSIKTLLDVGGGDAWFTERLPGVEHHIIVDIWQSYLDKAKEKNIPGLVTYCMDLREYLRLQADMGFDCVAAIDVIEHFEEPEARWLISEIGRTASKLAIIWTTLGYIYQAGVDNNGMPNPYQEHHCGPMPDWFPAEEGWTVVEHPEWHGPRGGGIFAYKVVKPAKSQDLRAILG